MSLLRKEIEEMGGNERGFFSLWSDVIELDQSKLFLNRNFPDDLLFNRVFEVNTGSPNLGKIIEGISSYFERLGVRPSFFVPEHQGKLEDKLSKKGFRHIDIFNSMKLTKFVLHTNREAKIEEISRKNLAIWIETYMRSFDIAPRFKREVQKRSEISAKDRRSMLYLARVKGVAAGTSLAFSENGVTGFYCVGTLPKFRGIGIASQLLEVGIDDSKKRGDHLQCLQNLEGDKVREFYEKRGFETIFVKKVYQKV